MANFEIDSRRQMESRTERQPDLITRAVTDLTHGGPKDRSEKPIEKRGYKWTGELHQNIRHLPRLDIVGGDRKATEAALLASTLPHIEALAPGSIVCVIDASGTNLSEKVFEETAKVEKGAVSWEVSPKLIIETTVDTRLIPDLIVASMGEEQRPTESFGNKEREILREVCTIVKKPESQDDPSTLEQISATLGVILGKIPDVGKELTSDQIDEAVDLFSPDYFTANSNLISELKSHVSSLLDCNDKLPAQALPNERPQLFNFVIPTKGGRLPKDHVSFLVEHMTTNLAERFPYGHPDTIVVVGGENVDPQKLNRMSRLCEQRGVRQIVTHGAITEQTLAAIGNTGAAIGALKTTNAGAAQQVSNVIGSEFQWVTTGESESSSSSESRSKAHQEKNHKKLFSLKDDDDVSESSSSDSGESRSYQEKAYVHPSELQKLGSYEMLLVVDTTEPPVQITFAQELSPKGAVIIESGKGGQIFDDPTRGLQPDDLLVTRLHNWRRGLKEKKRLKKEQPQAVNKLDIFNS